MKWNLFFLHLFVVSFPTMRPFYQEFSKMVWMVGARWLWWGRPWTWSISILARLRCNGPSPWRRWLPLDFNRSKPLWVWAVRPSAAPPVVGPWRCSNASVWCWLTWYLLWISWTGHPTAWRVVGGQWSSTIDIRWRGWPFLDAECVLVFRWIVVFNLTTNTGHKVILWWWSILDSLWILRNLWVLEPFKRKG